MNATRGLVIVNTGNGKGKTTAALGMMLRAWGNGLKVVMLQFVKSSTADYGEHRAARRVGLEIVSGGAGLTREGNLEKNRSMAIEMWKVAAEKIGSGSYDMVVLDELTYPLRYGWLAVGDVLDVLGRRPKNVHVVITGRNAPRELIDFADAVVEMMDMKHHLREGIKAQPGIEF